MKKILLSLLIVLSHFGLTAETIKTKQIDDGGTDMLKAIAVKDSEIPEIQSIHPLWIVNGDRQIYGELFTPQGDSKGVAIVSHGFNGTHQSGRNYFDLMQELGYQCYVFDFPCGSVNSRSDNNTLNMSIFDEQSDLIAIANYFRQQDPNQEIMLIGESQGGLISALTAAQLGDEISRLILVFPALCIPDDWRKRYPHLSDIPEVTDLWGVKLGRRFFEEIHDMHPLDIIGKYHNPVLIVQGDKDNIVSMEDSEKASQLYEDARLHIIPGAGHGFKPAEMKELKEHIRLFMTK